MLRLVHGCGDLYWCIGCKSKEIFVCRITGSGKRIAVCEKCWIIVDYVIEEIEWKRYYTKDQEEDN